MVVRFGVFAEDVAVAVGGRLFGLMRCRFRKSEVAGGVLVSALEQDVYLDAVFGESFLERNLVQDKHVFYAMSYARYCHIRSPFRA